MCEQCQYAHAETAHCAVSIPRPETVQSAVSNARPDQILRLLRDIRRAGDTGGVEETAA